MVVREVTRATQVVIVPLEHAHLDQVLAIEAQVASTGWSRGIFEREMVADAARCYLVALRPATAGGLPEPGDLPARPAPGGDPAAVDGHRSAPPGPASAPGYEVVGYAGMQVHVDEAHITTMTVAPVHRRGGVATRLLVELLREARARGAASATLEVRIDNQAARRLYARMGFRPVGVRPKYYDAGVDALIMWAHDIDGPEFGRMLRDRVPLPGVDAQAGEGGEC